MELLICGDAVMSGLPGRERSAVYVMGEDYPDTQGQSQDDKAAFCVLACVKYKNRIGWSGMEIRILDWIQNLRTPVMDKIMLFITGLGDAGMIWILLAVFLLVIPRTRRSGAILAAALCVDAVLCNGILKQLFGRTRPFDVNTSIQLLLAPPGDFSFPSGHTAASFAAATSLFLAKERHLWKPVLVLAVLIAFSRLYLYVHYPTDILGGIAVGIVAGYLSYAAVHKAVRWKEKRRTTQE